MELKLKRQPLFINEVLVDENVEQPIECDALLPDYCPDIVRILKCTVTPTVAGRRAAPGRLEIEGMAVINIHYVSTGEGIAKGEYKVPFSRIVEMKTDSPAPVLTLSARTDYVNCRAVNQRRLDIRGALVISVRAVGCREEQVVAEGDGMMGLQVKREQQEATRLLGQGSRDLHITEKLDLTYGKPPIQSITSARASLRMTECKLVAGKAVLRGEMNLHILYYTTAGAWEQLEYALPTNSIVELDGLDENSLCHVEQNMISLSAEPTADAEGEYRCINLDALMLTTVRGWQPYTAHFCSDCYSTRNQCTFRTRALPLTRLCSVVKESFPYKENITLPENVDTILDLWCDVAGLSTRGEGGGMVAEAKLTVSMFAKMTDGQLYFFDKTLETSHKVVWEGEEAALEARMLCQSCAYSFVANDSVELRCDLELSGTITAASRAVLLEEITLDEKKPKENTAPAGLYLYIADGGETLWDIAKRYNTNIDKITEENPQDGDPQGRKVLLIPVL